jgi:diguanylate cyclase (GGDEF)-like protein/PAS domain S-box-containing protein
MTGRPLVILAVLVALVVPAVYAGDHVHAGYGGPIWTPAAAVVLALFLIYGVIWLPAVLVVAVAVVVAFDHPHASVAAVTGAAAAGLVVYAAVALLARWASIDLSLRRLRDGVLLCATGLVGAAGSAAARGAVLAAEHRQTWSSLGRTWQITTVHDLAGVECLAPLLVVAASRWSLDLRVLGHLRLSRIGPAVRSWAAVEMVLQLVAVVVAADLAQTASLTSARFYPLLLPLAWIALSRGIDGVVLAVAVGASVTVGLAARSDLSTHEIEALGLFLAVFAIGGVMLGALETQRRREISDRRAIEFALRDSEERSRLLIEGTTDYAICMLDPGGVIITWNMGAQRISGFSSDEIVGNHFSILYPPDSLASKRPADALRQAARHGRYSDEGWRLRKDGTRYWAGVVITALWDSSGSLRGFANLTHDLTERRQAEEQLTVMATHDGLTGLPNRRLFMERLEHALENSDRRPGAVAVLFADLDRFKDINDTWGHDSGDQVLALVANRIRSVLRPNDTAARLGGDEFVMVCEDLVAEDEVIRIARRIEEAVARPCQLEKATLTITASIGIAIAGRTDTAEDILRHADEAMYEAKQGGRAQHRVYREAPRDTVAIRMRNRDDLRTAMERGELSLAYEPVVDIHTGDVVAVEAIPRWLHPTQGLLMPSAFLPLAESDALITIGDWMLRTACIEVAGWRNRLPRWQGMVFVTVSGRQLARSEFVDHVQGSLKAADLEPDRLCLETTESVLLLADRSTRKVIDEIKGLGSRLAIDEFGTGYASLSNLREFPFDAVKIDPTFSAGLGTNRDDEALVRTILELAASLELDAIIEGVETLGQLGHVIQMGGRYAQGTLFGRPLVGDGDDGDNGDNGFGTSAEAS